MVSPASKLFEGIPGSPKRSNRRLSITETRVGLAESAILQISGKLTLAKVPRMGLGEVGIVVGVVISIGALIVAFLARRDSRAAARAAETSAESSERSAVAAEQSLELSRLESRRQVERTDVEWEREQPKKRPGVVAYRNIGTTTAFAVTAVITVNGQRFDLQCGNVTPDGLVEHDATHLYNLARQDSAALVSSMSRAGISYFGSAHFAVTARISWQSELGTPSIRTL